MAIELVTGKAGTPHISSEDVGLFQAGVCGAGVLLLADRDGFYPSITLQDANRINIPIMNLVIDGRHVRISAAETLTITPGISGQKRIDLVCLRYTRTPSTGIESVSLEVVRGVPTPATPDTPTTTGSILEGAISARYPIASIKIDGLTPEEPVMLAHNLLPSGGAGLSLSRPPLALGYRTHRGTYASGSWYALDNFRILEKQGITANHDAFTIEHAGIYELTSSCTWQPHTFGRRGLAYMVNGTNVGPENLIYATPNSSATQMIGPTHHIRLDRGARVQVRGYQESGQHLFIYNAYFSCRLISK